MRDSKKIFLFTVLSFTLLLTGCLENGGEETISEGRSFEITDFDCYPVTDSEADCSTITEFEDIVITVTAKNVGDSEIRIPFDHLGGNQEDHRMVRASIIQDRCPSLFDMEESSVDIRKITADEIIEYNYPNGNNDIFDDGNNIVLGPGEELDFEWNIHLVDDEGLQTGYECSLDFEIITEQTVTSTKEIEFSEDPGGSINPAISSTGPVKLNIKAPSTWETGGREFPVTIFVSDQGYGDILEDIQLLYSDPGAGVEDGRINCEIPDEEGYDTMRMLRDDSGESVRRTFLCQQETGGETSAFLWMEADYRYRYKAGNININLCREGDPC